MKLHALDFSLHYLLEHNYSTLLFPSHSNSLCLFVCLLLCLKYSHAGLTGILFSSQQEYAFSVMNVWFAMGFVCGFAIALFLDLETQLWIILGIVVLHFVTYTVLIFRTQTKKQLLPCCTSSEKEDENTEEDQQNLMK